MNQRIAQGPKEGKPGEMVIVTATDVVPPMVWMATVEEDGYFADELYDEMDAARNEQARSVLRHEGGFEG